MVTIHQCDICGSIDQVKTYLASSGDKYSSMDGYYEDPFDIDLCPVCTALVFVQFYNDLKDDDKKIKLFSAFETVLNFKNSIDNKKG